MRKSPPISGGRGCPGLRALIGAASLALSTGVGAQSAATAADTAPQSATPAADGGASSTPTTEQRLQRLEQRQQELEQQLRQKDAEIQSLRKQQANAPSAQPSTAVPAATAGAGAAAAGQPAATAQPAISEEQADIGEEDAEQGQAPPAGQPPQKWGTYRDFNGFKVANTDKGDLNVAIYSYVRYLNQKGLDPTYTDAFGNVKTVQQRQEVQILKVQIKFLGWLFDEKFRYFLYAWSSNATQGQGAQVVLAGNLGYTFNEHLTVAGGITSLPGVRTTEGNFPFWLSVDNRLMADEFFRPSYTSGFWVRGNILPDLRYQAMVGNNLSTLGVSSAQLDNKLDTVATALVWTPTTGEFGVGFGDFEQHEKVATRLGVHYTQSTETKQSQPNTEGFENTQIRLSDGSIVFTPNLFGPGIIVEQLRYQMQSLDGGVKYRGWALEGELYWRELSQFQGPGTGSLPNLFDRGWQLQASYMVVPKTFQVYAAGSYINGEYGKPWDARVGVNWHPWHNRVFRWNTQAMYLKGSPVGYTSLTYNVGSKGYVFNTDFEMAF
jgi:TolA-binding protein